MLLVVVQPVEAFQWCAIQSGLKLFCWTPTRCSEKTVAAFCGKPKKILQRLVWSKRGFRQISPVPVTLVAIHRPSESN